MKAKSFNVLIVTEFATTFRDLTIENCETSEIPIQCPVTRTKFIKDSNEPGLIVDCN